MGKTKVEKTYILEIVIKIQFFWYIYCKIPFFFRISITIQPGRSLLSVRYHELFDTRQIH